MVYTKIIFYVVHSSIRKISFICGNILLPMFKKEDFFTEYKVSAVSDEEYAKASSYIDHFMKAFANTTYKSLYLIDYYKKTFLYVSENPLFLCGLSPKEMKKLGFDFYLKYVPENEQRMLLEVNHAGFQFIKRIKPEKRCEHTISYDFHILPPQTGSLLINHKITPVLLTTKGDIWLALCTAQLSSESASGYVEMTCRTNSKLWRLEYGLWKEYPGIELNENERLMLRLTAEGFTIEKIAEKLFKSVETVKSYRRSVFKKLEVGNITEAITASISKKLI